MGIHSEKLIKEKAIKSYEGLSTEIKYELKILVDNLNQHKKDFRKSPDWAFDELRTVLEELRNLNEIFGN